MVFPLLRLIKATIWLSALAFLVPASHASMIFDATATASNGADLTGTITIDTVLGKITAVDLSLSAPASFSTTVVGLQGPGGSGFYAFLTTAGPFVPPYLSLSFPVTNLIGYTGGVLCTGISTCGAQSSGYVQASGSTIPFQSVTLTAEAPEPVSAVLAGGGLFALGLLRRRRRNSL
jgi:MYXO-CTERM domain-containing protein